MAAAVALPIAAGGGAAGGSIVAHSTAGEHASLKSYPEAVLTATDAASGTTLSVAPNGTVLTAEKDGRTLWSVDIVAATGKPATGFPVIRLVEVTKPGTAMLVVGKGRAVEVEIASGRARALGED
jgi:hypothetical protein